MLRKGLADLAFLPRSRCGWNATLAAVAYSARRRTAGQADLNLWAVMHGCAGSARYAELGRDALVLWHGTSARRAEKIRDVGLYPKKGIWATAEPQLAHSFCRSRSDRFSAGAALIVLVLDRENIPVAFEMASEHDTLRFRSPLGPEHIEYILWDDRIEFAGLQEAPRPRPWGAGRFKKIAGRWVPRSRPPVRFDHRQSYADPETWLELSVRRVLGVLGRASAIEVFSSLYCTIDPPEALAHEAVFAALDRLCTSRKDRRGGLRQFSLRGGAG